MLFDSPGFASGDFLFSPFLRGLLGIIFYFLVFLKQIQVVFRCCLMVFRCLLMVFRCVWMVLAPVLFERCFILFF